MTTNVKLLAAALGLLAIAATPAAAKTHHVHMHASHIVRVAPPVLGWQGAYRYQTYPAWQGAYAYQPSSGPLSASQVHMDGFQKRQMVGQGYETNPAFQLPTSFLRYNGYQHDRQMVSIGE